MPYIVYTKPREECRARDNLERQGFGVFLPFCRIGKSDPRPLFPRYVFVWSEGLNWGTIRNTRGVCHLIRNDGKPVEIQDSVVWEIKSRMSDGVIKLTDPSAREFKKNQKIRIIAGKYAEMDGLFVSREKDRIIALVSMMGRMVKAKVPEKSVV